MKFISSVIGGIVIGAFSVWFALKWEDEDLKYLVTPPAQFGEVIYQNIQIANTGWNPAENVKLYINSPDVAFENVRSTTEVQEYGSEKNGILVIERIRKNEQVNLSIAYTGNPISENEIKFASNRSIATSTGSRIELPYWFYFFSLFAVSLYMVLLISEWLYPFFKMKEKEKEKEKEEEEKAKKKLNKA